MLAAVDWRSWAEGELDTVRAAGKWRQPRSFDARGPAGTLDDRAVVSFASNDYLGLSVHPAVIAAAHAAIDRWGTGATAARLLVGSRPVHHELEHELAQWKCTERALVLPTGYAANLSAITVMAGPHTTVLSDELNHASIIDGCRLSRCDLAVYQHNNLEHLAKLLTEAPGRAVVVTEAVFSMDGDAAPVDELVALCERHGALLIVDEAHAVFAEPAPLGDAVLRVGTLSKTLGSVGGFIAGPAPLLDLIVNRGRSFIFTTAPAPADMASALAALQVLRGPEGADRRDRLRRLVDRVRPHHPSPIIPVVLGSEERALQAAAALLERGLWVPAVRPPTVPAGTSRLRLTLSAAHTDDMVDRLLEALGELSIDAST
jgi:8-amino-7-oxononanoate synthase